MPNRHAWLSVCGCGLLVLLTYTLFQSSAKEPYAYVSEVDSNSLAFVGHPAEQQHIDVPEVHLEHKIGIVPSKEATNPAAVPLVEHDPTSNEWREHLAAQHGPETFLNSEDASKKRTLGFSHIYVVPSLQHLGKRPQRGFLGDADATEARRKRMQTLATALELDFTFVERDIIPSQATVAWIAEQVAAVRLQKALFLSEALNRSINEVGGMQPGSVWLHPSVELRERVRSFAGAIGLHSEQRYPVKVKNGYGSINTSFPALSHTFSGKDWLSHLNSDEMPSLEPRNPSLDVQALLRDPLEPSAEFQLNASTISEWFVHHKVMQLMQKNEDESALIITDDIDTEWDITSRWANIHRFMPAQRHKGRAPWHIAFLGHCSAREQEHPSFLHPRLHQSGAPACLNAYAISKTGLAEILHLLEDPWTAYQTKLSTALSSFLRARFINAFSVDPPLFVSLSEEQVALDISHVGDDAFDHSVNAATKVDMQANLGDSASERLWRHAGYQLIMTDALPPSRPSPEDYRLYTAKGPASKPKVVPPPPANASSSDVSEKNRSPKKSPSKSTSASSMNAGPPADLADPLDDSLF